MIKRSIAAGLWFISAWFAFGLAVYPFGLPADGGAILGALLAALVWMDPTGALLAALVWMDPTGAFWGPRQHADRAPARIDRSSATAPTP